MQSVHAAFAHKEFTAAMDIPMPHKLVTFDENLALLYPCRFELGQAEYKFALDSFLESYDPITVNSETAVASRDFQFLKLMKALLPRAVISTNQVVASSAPDRHDFAVAVGGYVVALGEQKVDDDTGAIAQLVKSVIPQVLKEAIPVGCTQIPAFASTNQLLVLYALSVDDDNKVQAKLIKEYYMPDLPDRISFCEDLYRIVAWIAALPRDMHRDGWVPGICQVCRILKAYMTNPFLYTHE